MIVTIFRNRLVPENQPEYDDAAAKMSELAPAIPGYVANKSFAADDGERVTIVEFADEASHKAWASHPGHVATKLRGRDGFYTEYSLQVCSVTRASKFTRRDVA